MSRSCYGRGLQRGNWAEKAAGSDPGLFSYNHCPFWVMSLSGVATCQRLVASFLWQIASSLGVSGVSLKPSSEAVTVPQFYPPEILRREAAHGGSNVVIVCEHAINTIPPEFGDLGLDPAARQSHIAWDPGALGVAHEMRRLLNADLVAGSVSRLLCDCNRPPEAPSAMPEMSEIFKIPGNWNLTERDRQRRTTAIYKPFYAALKDILDAHGEEGVLITVHSFTPVFKGVPRVCEIGILHDVDARLADAMFAATPSDFPFKVDRNVPYSASDGVTHTLKEHALARGWPNVMIEIRNDLIGTQTQQSDMARHLVALFSGAASSLEAPIKS